MRSVKRWIVLIIILSIIFLTGCWNYRDINQLAIVSGLAIDKASGSDKYRLTAEIVDFSLAGKEASINSKIIEAEGKSVFDAARNMLKTSPKRLYWGHTAIYIINEELAREGIVEVLDWISRDAEPRAEASILISKENTAKSILMASQSAYKPISRDISRSLKAQESAAKSFNVEVYKFINNLSMDGVSATLPVISLIAENNQVTYNIAGTAIFKGDKLIGFLDGEDTKFFLFIIDKIQGGLLLTEYDGDSHPYVITLEIFENKTKFKSDSVNGKLVMKLDIKSEVSIAELDTHKDVEIADEYLKIKSDAEKALESKIKNVIEKVQKNYGTDIFGFGRAVKNDFPQLWKSESKNWSSIFQDLPVDINAELEVKNTALTSKPIKIGD